MKNRKFAVIIISICSLLLIFFIIKTANNKQASDPVITDPDAIGKAESESNIDPVDDSNELGLDPAESDAVNAGEQNEDVSASSVSPESSDTIADKNEIGPSDPGKTTPEEPVNRQDNTVEIEGVGVIELDPTETDFVPAE